MSAQITTASRRIVGERSQGICEICHAARATEISHRRPKGMGGTTVIERHLPAWLIHACSPCHHQRVERDRDVARSMGWLLDDGARPEDVAAFIHPATLWLGWWILDNDGGFTLSKQTV